MSNTYPKARMTTYDSALMAAPSYQPGYCVVCGATPVTSHHVVPRARGGHQGPQLHLCGHGTVLCHGDAEDKRLHFRDRSDAWEYLRTAVPTKYHVAIEMDGWLTCG